MIRTVHGVVHGKTIQLAEDLGVAEGQAVEVQVKILSADKPWGEGIRRSAGALADEWTEEDDRILDEIYRERKQSGLQRFAGALADDAHWDRIMSDVRRERRRGAGE